MRKNMREDHHEYLEITYFTPSEFEKAGNVWPIRIGHNIAKSNYHIGPRTTPYYYLIFVLEGQGTFIQNNQTFLLGKGDMFCLFPQVTHEYWTIATDPLHKIFVAFDGKQSLHLLERIGLSPYSPHLSGTATERAISFMWDFIGAVGEGERQASDLTRLHHLYRVFDSLSGIHKPAATPHKRALTWLQMGLAYMQIHYAEGISVERVSEHVGVERTHFTKQFSKTYGVTPMQYLQSLKMNEAKLLLEQTAYTLSEIASSVGYPDLFSFSKAFKKQIGVPPTLYREQNRSN
ncbi:helix-turn-helix transcriptional regulator [Paenibacillus aceris]|uniref:AraC-like DNA-binding protein n=1 Tax=Paenibacillus aceris TaxID=869555 RepID=A0ABS4HSG9_9BACL|nr:AraC family transcriptional regulator [Paenibacillus aceris]MBP1961573.1 AraC-like DNA-binding protein [Paenibacillus aceris]NHW37653.1 AraC family transcriptional regulator [Paenibacillus aceris]